MMKNNDIDFCRFKGTVAWDLKKVLINQRLWTNENNNDGLKFWFKKGSDYDSPIQLSKEPLAKCKEMKNA